MGDTDIDYRTWGATRNCKGCRYWSEMVAHSIGGGPVQAMCLSPRQPEPQQVHRAHARVRGACTCQGPDGPCGDCQSAQADYEEWLDDPQVTPRELRAYAAAREAAERERVRGVLEAAQNDAMRFRWLTEDHADPETRAKCRELLSRMGVMTYSAACTDIDSAMAQATKREMLRTAGEWQRRYEPTCAHGRYSDEDCTDCPRTAVAGLEIRIATQDDLERAIADQTPVEESQAQKEIL